MSRFLTQSSAAVATAGATLSALQQLDRLLTGTLQLRRRAAAGEPIDEQLEALRSVYRELESAQLVPLHARPAIRDDEAAHACAAGALRLKYYRQTVLSRRPLIDTVGSQTLGEYEPDLHLRSQAEAERWRSDVAAACGLSMQALDVIELEILPDEIHAVGLRKRLMDALVEVLGLHREPQRAAWRLLSALFPGHPLREDECGMVCTAASVYLCLPYDQGRWTSRGPEQLQDPALIDFLRLISRPLQTTMAHFPAFAPVQAERIDPELLRQLAAHCGQDIDELRLRLCTMVTILPSPKLDQFIIHDVWGHQWQAHLFRFEEAYLRVAGMTRKPALDPAMRAVLEQHRAGRHQAARAAWQQQLDARLDANLLDSLTGLVAEVFADAIEHKFLVLHPERQALLLSSSYFKELPTKLDLTLADLPLYFRFATRGLRRLADGQAPEPLQAQISAAFPDWSATEVETASQALSAWTDELLSEPRWAAHFDTEHDSTAPSAFTATGHEFARFHLAFNRVHAELGSAASRQPVHPLLPRYQDLLIFCCAAFFEDDRALNFWRLAEFVEQHFVPMYRRLLAAGQQTQ